MNKKPISSQQVKTLRTRVHKTQTEAANDVHVSLRTWQNWEAPEDSAENRKMPEAHLELFCIKNKIKYPPRF